MRHRITIYFGVPAMIFMAGILFSCENDMDAIERVTYDEQAPDEVTKDLNIIYTDSGYAQVRIKAALAETVKKPRHITKLKDGLRIDFFGDSGEVTSTLTALYGEVNYNTGKMFVRDSVVLYNYEKKQWLESEEMIYNRVDSMIYVPKYYVIRKAEKGITGSGEGLKTTYKFDKDDYSTRNPQGTIDE